MLDPTPTATADASPEATGQPTETPTQDSSPSADLTAELEAEITAFFEKYAQTINESWTSEEALKRRREMFADSCEVCLRGYEFTERAHEEDLEFVGEYGEVLSVRLESSIKRQVTFSVDARSPAAELVNQIGETVQEFEEYGLVQTVYQARRLDSGAWIIIAGETL